MSPPQLTADAPVADVLVPRLERLGVAGGEELQLAFPRLAPIRGLGILPELYCWSRIARKLGRDAQATGRGRSLELLARHRAQGGAGEPGVGHLAVPLVAEIRLDRHVTAVAVADAVAVGLDLFEQVVALEPIHDGAPRLEPVEAEQEFGATRFAVLLGPAVAVGDRAVRREDVDQRQLVSQPDVVV